MKLTEIAHEEAARVLQPGDLAMDATVGNGHDTLMLAGAVNPGGRVHGFDIQPEALQNTRLELERANLDAIVSLHQAGHETMDQHLPVEFRNRTAAIFFNLGYLPGGDKSIITKPGTTLTALRIAFEKYLGPGGILSILSYPGHPGGGEEMATIKEWLVELPESAATIETHTSSGPVLNLVKRTRNRAL